MCATWVSSCGKDYRLPDPCRQKRRKEHVVAGLTRSDWPTKIRWGQQGKRENQRITTRDGIWRWIRTIHHVRGRVYETSLYAAGLHRITVQSVSSTTGSRSSLEYSVLCSCLKFNRQHTVTLERLTLEEVRTGCSGGRSEWTAIVMPQWMLQQDITKFCMRFQSETYGGLQRIWLIRLCALQTTLRQRPQRTVLRYGWPAVAMLRPASQLNCIVTVKDLEKTIK